MEQADSPGVSEAVAFAAIDWRGERVRLEYRWIGPADPRRPVIVFLHEGLGSVSMWRDFPAEVCAATGARGLVFSRPGYGRSTRPAGDVREPDYLHRQAYEVLPTFLDAVGLDEQARPPWIFGHSDGGTIALLYAARFPGRVAGLVVVAPHLFVEQVTVEGVARARAAYGSDTRARLARHHADPDWVFASWSDIWLDPRFRDWNIEAEVAGVRCPVLAVQGLDDEYATLEQIRAIVRRAPDVKLLEVSGAGHVVHRDRPRPLVDAVRDFIGARA